MASKGYSYATNTNDQIIPNGGKVTLWYPLADASSGHVNQSEADVVVAGNVLARDKVGVEFDQASETITVTNLTDEDWPPYTDVIVAVPSDLNLGGVEAVIETLVDHEARLDAIDGTTAALEARVAALETPPEPVVESFSGDDKVTYGKRHKGK